MDRAAQHVLAEAAVVGVSGGGGGERSAEADPVDAEVVGAGGEVDGEAGGGEIGWVEGLDDALVGAVEGRGDVQVGAAGGEVFGGVGPGTVDECPGGVDDVEGDQAGAGVEAEHVHVGVALDDPEAAEGQSGEGCRRGGAVAVVVSVVGEAVVAGDDGEVVLGVVGAVVVAFAPLGEVFVVAQVGSTHDGAPAGGSGAAMAGVVLNAAGPVMAEAKGMADFVSGRCGSGVFPLVEDEGHVIGAPVEAVVVGGASSTSVGDGFAGQEVEVVGEGHADAPAVVAGAEFAQVF